MGIIGLIILIIIILIIIIFFVLYVFVKNYKMPPKRIHCYRCGKDFEVERLKSTEHSLTMTYRNIYCPYCNTFCGADRVDNWTEIDNSR
jgi:DNA-directed RNA polymerase subunit RPC12/RpoP